MKLRTVMDKGDGVILTVNYHRDFAADEDQARAEYIQGIALLESQFLDFARSLPFDQMGVF
jgi:hypothetical protein